MIVDKAEALEEQNRSPSVLNPPPAYQPDPVDPASPPGHGQPPPTAAFVNSTPLASFPQPAFLPERGQSYSPSPPPANGRAPYNGLPEPQAPFTSGSLNSRQGSTEYTPNLTQSHNIVSPHLSPQPTGSLNRQPTPQQYGSQGSQQWGQQEQPQARRAMSAAEIGERYRAEQFALCAAGKHEPTTKYGVCGIVCAIILFPIGFICMFMDTEERCTRCGNTL